MQDFREIEVVCNPMKDFAMSREIQEITICGKKSVVRFSIPNVLWQFGDENTNLISPFHWD
jgi:hypothetical protein